MPKGYPHLSRDQRCQLYTLKEIGESTTNIATTLGVHRSALYRELKRNAGQRGYRYQPAHEKALERNNSSARNNLKMTPQLITTIEALLISQWSPDQISGRPRKENGHEFVSYESIYRHIWKEKLNGGCLYKELRHHGKKYNK